MKPDIPWILRHRIIRPEYRYYWLKGNVERDGFKWTTRGLKDGHYAYVEYEPQLKNYILSGGNLFVDIGSHVGTWSIRASKVYDKVLAFEPTIGTSKVLEKNLQLNDISNVEIENTALGDTDGWGIMYKYFSISGGGNTLLDQHPSFPNRIGEFVNKTNIKTLDSYDLNPDVIKIDTEGYEVKVLDGAKSTLKKTKKVIVEIHSSENLIPSTNLLHQAGLTTSIVYNPSFQLPQWLIGERE